MPGLTHYPVFLYEAVVKWSICAGKPRSSVVAVDQKPVVRKVESLGRPA
jgi:hypothetical protein